MKRRQLFCVALLVIVGMQPALQTHERNTILRGILRVM